MRYVLAVPRDSSTLFEISSAFYVLLTKHPQEQGKNVIVQTLSNKPSPSGVIQLAPVIQKSSLVSRRDS